MEERETGRKDSSLRVVVDNTKRMVSCYDYSLLFVTLFLAAFGLVMIYSSSAYRLNYFGEKYDADLRTQLIGVAIGSAAILIVSFIDYRVFFKKSFGGRGPSLVTLGYILIVAALVLVFFIGKEVNGATRWIPIGPVQVQPSEIAKIISVMFAADLVKRQRKRLDSVGGFIWICIYFIPVLLPVFFQSMTTMIIIGGIIFFVSYMGSRKRLYFWIIFGIVVACGIAYLLLSDGFRGERLDIWLHIEDYSTGNGRQVLQGLYAIASGGLFGKGLGNGSQKLLSISDPQNDMIFSVICEELGIFGAIALILLFGVMIYRLYRISLNAPDLYGTYLTAGIMVHMILQVVINLAVVTNCIPNTGVPLPFISAGGTSVIVYMAEIGLALSVSRQSEAV